MIGKIVKITINTMLLALLVSVVALPASTFSWLKFQQPTNQDVLPAETQRLELSPETAVDTATQDINETTETTLLQNQ